jgi:phosphinothricin acetyltransferase
VQVSSHASPERVPPGPRIRLASIEDADACAAIYRQSVVGSATSFELDPPDAAELARRIERTLARTPWLIADIGGRVAGYAYAGRHREREAYSWTAESTVYVDEDFTGRGVGRALMSRLLAILRVQGFHLVVAGITLPNDASVGLHRALGFAPVGVYPAIGWKSGQWWSTGWFALELGPRAAAAPIRPLPDLLAAGALADVLGA